MTSLTAPSSAEILPFQANQPTVRKGSFEAWRESWVRAVFADGNLWNCDKAVAGFLSFHLNRETRTCFPSYATIGRGIGIDRLNARRSIKRLIARGYLAREQRGKGQSNLYSPAEGVVVHDHRDKERVWSYTTTGVVNMTTPGVVADDHLTSESLTSDLTLGDSEKGKGGLPKGKEEKKDSVWVRYDSPQWDLIERYGHQATGKLFFRFGRLDGDWFLKTDLKAIEALANEGG